MTETKSKIPFKDCIDRIKPYEPGKPIEEVERELGLKNVAKLASNENPLGPSKQAQRAMSRALKKASLYPDGAARMLKERLARHFELAPEHFVLGNGSNEIIELLARGFLKDGDRVVSSEHTFLVYPLITQVCGGEYAAVPMRNFRCDLEAILKHVNHRTRIIFIANPNNPTGTYVTQGEVKAFLKAVPPEVIVCMDEAYIDFSEAKDFPNLLEEVVQGRENIILLRTFSKSYGLAGLRIGFGIAAPSLIGYLNKVRQPFNVNQLAQAAACAALDDAAFLQKTRKLVSGGRLYLYREFTRMKLEFLSSEANFILVNVGVNARAIFEALLRHGIIVRPMNAYGLETYIRVTIGTGAELVRFVRALEKVLNKGASHT